MSATFTPEESGIMMVTFDLDASQLVGHDFVAFEVLTQGKTTVVTHENPKEEG